MQGTQTYGPYGSQQYQQGSMNTAKGYTGQYADPLTGFDYYNARYYDPVAGVFLSADSVQGNASGMNPYAYVGGNPETMTDPTGEMMCSATCGGGGGSGNPTPPPPPAPTPSCTLWCGLQNTWHNVTHTYQTAWNNVAHGYESIWQHDQSYVQQAQETVARTVSQGISALHIIIGTAIVAAVGIGVGAYLWWQHAHQRPPDWTNLSTSEGQGHYWYTERGRGPKYVETHVDAYHISKSQSFLFSRVYEGRNPKSSTSYFNAGVAQWAVDYALDTMTDAELSQLDKMINNPRSAGTLVLNRTVDRNVGYGYRYDKTTGTTTWVSSTNSYEVVIRIDASTGEPFIATSYPTVG